MDLLALVVARGEATPFILVHSPRCLLWPAEQSAQVCCHLLFGPIAGATGPVGDCCPRREIVSAGAAKAGNFK